MSQWHYYNEFDHEAAEWIRQQMAMGLLPEGVVDERSIVEVQAEEVCNFVQCHFFAGIGGWSHALRFAGWSPDRPVWTGSCPCQPYSLAGKGKGDADERNLWPQFYRLIRESRHLRFGRPDSVVGEQVASAIGHGWLDGVSADLEAEGYAVGSIVLGAHSVGAPHKRQRIYWCGLLPDGQRDFSGTRGLAEQPGKGDGAAAAGSHAESRRCGCVGLQLAAGDGREQRGAEPGGRGAECGRGVGGTLNASGEGSEERVGDGQVQREAVGTHERQAVVGGSDLGVGWLPNHERGGCGTNRELAGLSELLGETSDERLQASQPGTDGNYWSDYRVIDFLDGKKRRAEPEPVGLDYGLSLVGEVCRITGLSEAETKSLQRTIIDTFPKVADFPGRRMLLKGYGNAIVPELAAEFIRAIK